MIGEPIHFHRKFEIGPGTGEVTNVRAVCPVNTRTDSNYPL